MKNYFKHISILAKRLLLIIVFFQVSRFIFYCYNYSYFNIDFSELFSIFFFGLRFDWFAIVVVNSVFIILHIIPGNFKNHKYYQLFLFIYYFVFNAIVLLFNYIDVEYFKFTNKRTTADFFQLITTGNDTWVLLPQFIKDFWHIVLLWIITIVLIYIIYKKYLYPKFDKPELSAKKYLYQTILCSLVIALLFVSVRGYGYRPTGIISAARYTSSQNIPLILNTPFTIIKTIYKEDIPVVNYFANNTVEKIYSPINQYKSSKTKNLNVVIIILESFSKEYIGYYSPQSHYTPFLDSLIKNGLSCKYSFANGKKSMEALPAIISGLPSLMNNPFITSSYSSTNISSLAKTLKKYNYHTSFFHGGTNGTMGFDNFARLAGIDNYFGKSEYPAGNKDYDGKWGIFDEPFFDFFANNLNKFPQPFFSAIFTLSSHHPYTIPEKYKNIFKGGKHEILKSIEYTDFALRNFFKKASQMPWYENTLFVITADHTSVGMSSYYHNKLGLYAIPIVYFCPSDSSLKGCYNNITQQTDIFPSIIDYLDIPDKITAFGSSIFDSTKTHFAINYINGIYQLIQDNYVIAFDGEKTLSMYNFKTDSLLKNNLLHAGNNTGTKKMENLIKAVIQQFNNRLRNNNLTCKQ